MRVHVRAMEGIGDNLYSRPFVRMLAEREDEVFVTTSLPQLYSDLKVKTVRPATVKYRTQTRNVSSARFDLEELPQTDREVYYGYNAPDLKKHGIIRHIETKFGFAAGSTRPKFDLPLLRGSGLWLPTDQKIAVVRPVTERREWFCSSRNCNENYISWCARVLRDSGYYVISIADCEEGVEWIVGNEPPANLKLHKGELGITGTLALLQRANIVVGAPGFIVPAAICAGVPLFTIFGGRGTYDNPHQLFDLRLDLKKIGWALPDRFCRCNQNDHVCDKTISNLDHHFYSFMSRL